MNMCTQWMRRNIHNLLKRAWHEMNHAVISKNYISFGREHHTKLRRYDKWSAKIMTLTRSHTSSKQNIKKKKTIHCTSIHACVLSAHSWFLWHIVRIHNHLLYGENFLHSPNEIISAIQSNLFSGYRNSVHFWSSHNRQRHYFNNNSFALRVSSIISREFIFLIDKWWNRRRLSPHFWSLMLLLLLLIFFLYFNRMR